MTDAGKSDNWATLSPAEKKLELFRRHYNGTQTVGYDTTVGTANFLYGDGSVQSRNANAREQVCREEIVYLGRKEPRGKLYKDENTDHTKCGAAWN